MILSGHSLGQSKDHDGKNVVDITTEYRQTRENMITHRSHASREGVDTETGSLFGVDTEVEGTFIHSIGVFQNLCQDHDVTS